MVMQYRYWISGCFLAFVLFVFAVSFNASNRRSDFEYVYGAESGNWMDDVKDGDCGR